MFTAQLAEEIVSETMSRLGRNINIMDESGTIIASGNRSRVGSYHAAAAQAIRDNRILAVDEQQAAAWSGVQAGLNIPLHDRDRVVGAIGVTGVPQELEPFGLLVQMTTELMIRQNRLKLQDDWRQTVADLIVEELAAAEPNTARVDQRLEALGLQLQPPFQIFLVSYTVSLDRKERKDNVQAEVQRALHGRKALIGRRSPQKLMVLLSQASPAATKAVTERLRERLARHAAQFAIGIGCPADSRDMLHIASAEAELALRFGAGAGGGEAVTFPEVEAEALVHEIPGEHRGRLLSKLKPYWNGKIAATLDALFRSDLNIAAAAQLLGIHRNTLLYRIEQIKKGTGLDPLRFRDAVLLQFALWLNADTR